MPERRRMEGGLTCLSCPFSPGGKRVLGSLVEIADSWWPEGHCIQSAFNYHPDKTIGMHFVKL